VELWNGCFGLGAVLVMASRVYDDRYGQKQRAKLLSFPRKKQEMKTGGRWYYASGRIFTEKNSGSFQRLLSLPSNSFP
jgi:hypothetical protein